MTLLTISGRLRAAVQRRRRIAGPYRIPRVVFLVVAFGISASLAAADPAKRMFNIEAKPATQSLTDYARQAHIQLGYDVDGVDDILTNAVAGEYDSAEALKLLLEDTGLAAEYGERGIFIRRVAKREAGGDIKERVPPVAQTNSLQLAQTLPAEVQDAVRQSQTSESAETDSDEDGERPPLEEIIVTGTSIRGVAPHSSPTQTYTREDIQISGAATAHDFIQTLPFNFEGGSNANVPGGLPNDNTAGSNAGGFGSFGSSVNLRGLGSGSTLVLLNGHRIAPASFQGDFVDISMIPVSAVERVETLTDGASSIYGSDAIAGVVNFILRDDFEGLETSGRLGSGTQHGTPDQYRASITGGTNWDSGHALLVYEFFTQEQLSVEDRRFAQKDVLPNYLLPSQKRHSILASAAQDVGPNLELFADFAYSERKARQLRTQRFGDFTFQMDASTENLNISAGGTWKVSSEWFFDFSSTYSDIDTRNESSIDDDDIRVIDSSIWTADAKLSGPLFYMPGGDLKLAFGGHFRRGSFLATNIITGTNDSEAKREVYAVFGEAFVPIVGPDNSVPGIERIELSASGRYSDYGDFGSTANPKVGLLWSPVDGLNFRGSYSTSFKAPPLGQVGANNSTASLFRTSVLFSIFGLTPADPSLADVVQLTVGGTDKDLDPETSSSFTAGFDIHHDWGAQALSLSTTWFDVNFKNRLDNVPIPGGVTHFDAINIAFVDPSAFPEGTFTFFPSTDEISDAIDGLDHAITNPFGLDPFDTVFLSRVLVVTNTSRTVVRGFDFDLKYTYDVSRGSILLGLDGTYLQDVKQQAATTTPLVEQVDTLFNPVDLKLRGRASYSNANFSVSAFVNHDDDYQVDSTAGSARMDSWTTVDISLAYDTKTDYGHALLNDTVFRVFVTNVFDEDPPLAPVITTLRVDGYDPTNASPLGRFIAFEITRRW